MKFKFGLQTAKNVPQDLVATLEAATTVGDLADFLARAGGNGGPIVEPGEGLTLGLVGTDTRALDRRSTIADSGLRSGALVTLSRGGAAYQDPRVAEVAIATVTAGPGTGQEFRLQSGTNIIGRERGCEVRLEDPLVSRQHARLNVTDLVEVVDLGSANGITMDGEAVARSVLRPGDTIRVGDTELSVRMIRTPVQAHGVEGGAVSFVRSPRLDPVYVGKEFEAPEPPERFVRQRFPVIPLIAPILMGGLLYLITKSLTSLVFIGLSPVLLAGNVIESRVAGRAAFKKAVAQWRADVADLVTELSEEMHREAAGRNREHPPVEECVAAVHSTAPLLWTRRPGERGFAELKLGNGRQPSRNRVKLPDARRAPRALMKELVAATQQFGTIDDVPVVARPGEIGSIGFAGPRQPTLGAARALLTQVAALHSPAELILAGFASTQTAVEWDWLKWLPHASSPHSPLAGSHFASSAPAAAKLLTDLEGLIARRAAGSTASLPAVLVLIEKASPVEHSRLVELAERGWHHAIYVLWLASDLALLPAACRTFCEVTSEASAEAVGFVHSGEYVRPIAIEVLDLATAADVARRLAPVVDIGARVDDDSDLPRSVSLLSLTGVELATSAEAVIERWTENRSITAGPRAPVSPVRHAGTLRAVIGQAAGELLALDLRTDGPHALVGGTTGSGKSELLQAWILALASAHSPQRLTFLLVDYKGGSAFRDCVSLPHTVGLVTDLSPHLVRRALTSLSAELRYREHVLAKHGAKDLIALEKQGHPDVPPSLVLVVDEFAALVNEVPEFVDGVVNVAQRGRSLGLHLILATQRPAGVIKDNLRANTNLRLALRMADEADSTDVLGSPQAAFFDPTLPGRAVSKTGPGRLVPFQAAYAGGWTTAEAPPPEILVETLTFGAGMAWEAVADREILIADQGETDIKRLVGAVSAASELAEIAAPRKPWLPELKAVYDLANPVDIPSRRVDTELVYGIRDDPDTQSQPTIAFNPDRDGSLAVYGTGGSGKSTLLRTIAITAGFTIRGGPSHVYGIDFGGRGLAMLEDLPHVGSIVNGADHERITRLLGSLRDMIDERALKYSRVNAATITDYRRLAGVPDEPRILLLVDGVAAFRQAYEAADRVRWFDVFTSIASDGRPVGVHIILSSEQRSGMTPALASAVQARIVMRLATNDDYSLLGVAPDVLSASSPPGRGLVNGAEVQVAVLGGTADVVAQAAAVRGFGESMRRAGASVAPPIRSLPEVVPLNDLPERQSGLPVIGVSSSTLGPLGYEPVGTFLVSGPPGSGRSTALRALAVSLHRWRPEVELHYFGTRRSQLPDLGVWRSCACDGAVGDAASALVDQLAIREVGSPPLAVFIEGLVEFVNGPADQPLQVLVKRCIADGLFVIAEGETSTLGGPTGLVGALKTGRAGLALSPDTGDGMTIYRTSFGRVSRSEFVPGRALLVRLGKTEMVQIGQPAVTTSAGTAPH